MTMQICSSCNTPFIQTNRKFKRCQPCYENSVDGMLAAARKAERDHIAGIESMSKYDLYQKILELESRIKALEDR